MKRSTLLCSMLMLWPLSISQADFTEIDPFIGDRFESFSAFQGGTGGFQSLDIFQDTVTLFNLTSGGAIKIEFSSTLIFNGQSDTVNPRSLPVFMGQLGVLEWHFHQPVSKFGGYFENNSFADDVTFEFFDVNDDLIASVSANNPWAANEWTWNGWQSDIPIHRAVSTGNNPTLLNGFIWYDDLRLQYAPKIPEPSPFLLLGLVLAKFANDRHRRKRRY